MEENVRKGRNLDYGESSYQLKGLGRVLLIWTFAFGENGNAAHVRCGPEIGDLGEVGVGTAPSRNAAF